MTFRPIASSSAANCYLLEPGLMLEAGLTGREMLGKIEVDGMRERWKEVPGWEGVYSVSDHGRLKSFKGHKEGRILKNTNATGWYFNVVLCGAGRERQSVKLHKLVAEAFVERGDGGTEVNHKDCNKQNNHHLNLEWVTRRDNMRHAVSSKPQIISGMVRYNQCIRPKRVAQVSLDGRTIKVFRNAKEAGKATGVCGRNILQVASKTEYKRGKTRRQAGGFIWRFAENG